MKHTFNYVGMDGRYRPIISITLRLGKLQIDHLALLDSGADFNIFHSNSATLLKIDLKKIKNTVNFVGISGVTEKGYYTTVDIGINGHFITTPIIFSDAVTQSGLGVLGQQGFFNKYDVHFQYRKKKIIIED